MFDVVFEYGLSAMTHHLINKSVVITIYATTWLLFQAVTSTTHRNLKSSFHFCALREYLDLT